MKTTGFIGDWKVNYYKKCDLKGEAQSATEWGKWGKSVTLVGEFEKASLFNWDNKGEGRVTNYDKTPTYKVTEEWMRVTWSP